MVDMQYCLYYLNDSVKYDIVQKANYVIEQGRTILDVTIFSDGYKKIKYTNNIFIEEHSSAVYKIPSEDIIQVGELHELQEEYPEYFI